MADVSEDAKMLPNFCFGHFLTDILDKNVAGLHSSVSSTLGGELETTEPFFAIFFFKSPPGGLNILEADRTVAK